MQKKPLFTVTFITTFALGYAVKSLITPPPGEPPLKKATGIGGIFFKCKAPKKVRACFQTHPGLITNGYGAVFEWRQGSTQKGQANGAPFSEKTSYFLPSTKDFMLHYRVANLDALLIQLRKDPVTILDKVETADYGKFIHIPDIEGNKMELWEPNDGAFEKPGIMMGATTTK